MGISLPPRLLRAPLPRGVQPPLPMQPAPVKQFTADNPFTTTPMVYAPDLAADEETIRAREALIATGVFAGSEEVIRAGLLDHTHGIQTALELQRLAHLPLNEVALQPHRSAPKLANQRLVVDVCPPPRNYFWVGLRISNWLSRMHHRWVRHWVRYEDMKKQQFNALSLYIQIENKLLAAEVLSKYRMDLMVEQKREIDSLKRMVSDRHDRTKAQATLAFKDMLGACETEEERAALAALAQTAIVNRSQLNNTFTIQIEGGKKVPRSFCKMCAVVIETGRVCDPCLSEHKRSIDQRMGKVQSHRSIK